MDDLAVVKIYDLEKVIAEVHAVREEVVEMRKKYDLKAYTVKETADKLGVAYNTVRSLMNRGKLFGIYLNEKTNRGKRMIPAWSIKEYLAKKGK